MSLNLYTLDGKPVNIFDLYKNQTILLLFYHTSCLGCTARALPLAYQLSKEFSAIQLVVVHIEFNNNRFSAREINEVFTDGVPPFEIYIDKNAHNYKQYHAEGTPHWLIFDNKGVLKHSIFGSQANAKNRLLYALEEIQQE